MQEQCTSPPPKSRIYVMVYAFYFINEMPLFKALLILPLFMQRNKIKLQLGVGNWYPDVSILNKINQADLKNYLVPD